MEKWQKLFEVLRPIYQTCDRAHDERHIRRVLALRKAYWTLLVKENAAGGIDPLILDIAILLHELNRSPQFRGKDEPAIAKRIEFIQQKINESGFDFDEQTISTIVDAIETSHKPRSDTDSVLRTLLSDLDSCDMGAVGVLRMADVAANRGYGYAKARNFDPSLPATEGDENLDSVTDDIRFCLDWWNGPEKFRIQTPTIRKLAEHRFKFLIEFLDQLKKEFFEIGTL